MFVKKIHLLDWDGVFVFYWVSGVFLLRFFGVWLMGWLVCWFCGGGFFVWLVFCGGFCGFLLFLRSPKLSSLSVLFTFYKNESADEHKAM